MEHPPDDGGAQKAIGVGALVLDNVRVPATNLLGAPGAAWGGLSRALDIACLLYTSDAADE